MKQIKIYSLFFLCNFLLIFNLIGQVNYIEDLHEKRKIYVKEKKIKLAIKCSKRIINLAKENINIDSKKEYHRLGYYYSLEKKSDSAYFYYKKSKEAYAKVGDSLKVGEILKEISIIESDYQLYYKSDSTAIEALRYLRGRKIKTITSLYNCLGINSRNQKKYVESEKYYDKAIELTKDSIRKIRYLNNKAYRYFYLAMYSEANKIYKSLDLSMFSGQIPKKLKAKIIDNYAYSRFLAKEDIDVSEFFKAQKIKKEVKDFDGLITNYSYLSDFYKNKNMKISLSYAYRMYELSKNKKFINGRIEAIDRILFLEKEGNKKKLYNERIKIKDSIVDAERESQNKFVKVVYNFEEEKNKRLRAETSLAKEESKRLEQNLILEQQKSQKQLWIFIGLTTFLGFIVYFFYKRNKTKKEKIIEVYKTETRLAKKIHDELANDV